MKHPKRYCVKCNVKQNLVINGSMYHCRKCGEEVCRLGDGEVNKQSRAVRGGLDHFSTDKDYLTDGLAEILARENPDVMSDEHTLWPERDEEAEFRKQQTISKFKIAYRSLTENQQAVVEAVRATGTHEEAAERLKVSRPYVTKVINQVKKKLEGYVFGKSGYIGEDYL